MLNYQRLILINKITKDPGLFPRTRNQPGTIKELCSDAPRSNPQAPTQLLTYIYIYIIEGSLEVKLPTILTDGKAEVGRVREWGEEQKREDQRRERVRRKKMQVREKVGKQQNTMFFQWFVAPEGRKVGSLMGAEPSGQMRDEKLHAVVARSTRGSERAKNTSPSEHFWTLSCPKSARRCGAKHIWKSKWTKHTMFGPLFEVRAVVARTTFRSQNVQDTPRSEHFWKLRCRKSVRRCGAKHIPKSKCTKNISSEHFWKFRCRKSVRRCGAKHISKSKVLKMVVLGTFFGSWDVEKVHAVVARRTFPSQNV